MIHKYLFVKDNIILDNLEINGEEIDIPVDYACDYRNNHYPDCTLYVKTAGDTNLGIN